MPFEVQHYTLCDGWINTWRDINERGEETPSIYWTYTEALDELTDFLAQEHEAFAEGNIDSMYDINEFRIMEITDAY
jgi:hypothetical protein